MQHRRREYDDEVSKEEFEEGEEEESDEDYYSNFQDSDNPFGAPIDLDQNDINFNDHPLIQSTSKELHSVTLLVIEETLLEDFIIKDKAAQNRELDNIGEVKHDIVGDDSPSPTKLVTDNVKNNLQGEEEDQKADDQNEGNYFTTFAHIFLDL